MDNIGIQTEIIEKLNIQHNIHLNLEVTGYCFYNSSDNEITINVYQQIKVEEDSTRKKYFENCYYNFKWFIVNSFLHELAHQKQQINWNERKLTECRWEVLEAESYSAYRKCYMEKVANRFARRWLNKVIEEYRGSDQLIEA